MAEEEVNACGNTKDTMKQLLQPSSDDSEIHFGLFNHQN